VDLQTFQWKFAAIRAQGYVQSMRTGNTGVGYTLETLLGLQENNISLSDLQVAELKAKRENASSLVSFHREQLFKTLEP
jgi:hypothetical protein